MKEGARNTEYDYDPLLQVSFPGNHKSPRLAATLKSKPTKHKTKSNSLSKYGRGGQRVMNTDKGSIY